MRRLLSPTVLWAVVFFSFAPKGFARETVQPNGTADTLRGLHGRHGNTSSLAAPATRMPLRPKTKTHLNEAITKGTWTFTSRSFFMGTQQQGVLKDDWALAQGGSLGLKTAPIHGFYAHVSGFFVFNLGSSELAAPDPSTGLANRYELGQFDVTHPHEMEDLERLEDLNVGWQHRGWHARFGRMHLQTPFFNPQDGRMRPTLEQGLWIEKNDAKWGLWQGGWINGVSPRSTTRWYGLAESNAVFGNGVDATGAPKNLEFENAGDHAFLLNGNKEWHVNPHSSWMLKGWAMAWDRTRSTELVELHWKSDAGWHAAFQGIGQQTLGLGGHSDPLKAYAPEGGIAWVFGAQVGKKHKESSWSVQGTRITSHGMYLMPREWGRDPFFTFLPRERNEGLGDVWAATGKWTRDLKHRAQFGIAGGIYALPAVTEFALNKYGMPSYGQVNASLQWPLKGLLEGFDLQVLWVYKGTWLRDLPQKYVYNRVGLNHLSVVINYGLH